MCCNMAVASGMQVRSVDGEEVRGAGIVYREALRQSRDILSDKATGMRRCGFGCHCRPHRGVSPHSS